ncbi:hypothetical protein ATO8_05551 [Roseivivax marinus]|jgi:archaellum component FlaG (FlaF/FlaG flagellin family)|uniref:Uncharacterized protein n=1 Tax=Roseivivax marinus TaxID=1379903 RepID=W4HL73_9RHOB|nr:hypothetical protein [Roseivivax marinus]ETW13469.1 hypothetical protein ATO8_05551 [Roseivivax marinus]UMA65056.1 hypothetical protein LVO79_00840 [Roseivivax marinus]SEK59914.1 hypothetical protein SAMN05444413_102308 [Roseivivax marinus]
MFVTALSTLVLCLSALLVAANLRMIATDTATTLRHGVRAMTRGGRLVQNLSFVCLWLMIFALSYA